MGATIRMAAEPDAPEIAAIYAPFCNSNVVSFEYAAPGADEMAARIKTITAQLPWLILEDGGAVAGYAYASRHRERAAYAWAVDMAVYVAERFRGRGVGRALYTTLFDLLAAQGYFKAYAGITLPNPASVGLHEALGFTRVGVYRGVGYKNGGWRDVVWYAVALQPERVDPPPPIPVARLFDTDAWHGAVRRGISVYDGK